MKTKTKMSGLLVATFVIAHACFAQEKPAQLENHRKIATPESVLPAGVDDTMMSNPFTGEFGYARKGTVGATLTNIAMLNKLLEDVKTSEDENYIKEIIEKIKPLIPSLKTIGVFDVFDIEEWVNTSCQPGRLLVALLYLQEYPDALTLNIKKHLERQEKTTKSKILKEALSNFL